MLLASMVSLYWATQGSFSGVERVLLSG
jgi:hypothetical protein